MSEPTQQPSLFKPIAVLCGIGALAFSAHVLLVFLDLESIDTSVPLVGVVFAVYAISVVLAVLGIIIAIRCSSLRHDRFTKAVLSVLARAGALVFPIGAIQLLVVTVGRFSQCGS